MLIGNKVDRESERKVATAQAQAWCKENNDMLYFETSAKEGVSVDEAFVEMAALAVNGEPGSTDPMMMPTSAGGGLMSLGGNKMEREYADGS